MAEERVGFNIWTKNHPQDYIRTFAEHALSHGQSITAIVDDVLPQAVFKRTPQESAEYNELYRQAMVDAGFDEFVLVSEMLRSKSDLDGMVTVANRLSVAEFLALLPERKRNVLNELTMTELIDATWQINVLTAATSILGIRRYLTGKRSTALFRAAKDCIPGFSYEVIDP